MCILQCAIIVITVLTAQTLAEDALTAHVILGQENVHKAVVPGIRRLTARKVSFLDKNLNNKKIIEIMQDQV